MKIRMSDIAITYICFVIATSGAKPAHPASVAFGLSGNVGLRDSLTSLLLVEARSNVSHAVRGGIGKSVT